MRTTQSNRKIKVLFRLRSLEMGGVQKVVLDFLQNLPQNEFEFTLLVDLNQGVLRNDIPKHIQYKYIEIGKEDMSSHFFLKNLQLIKRRIRLEFFKKNPKILYKKMELGDIDIEIASSYTELSYVLSSPLSSKKIGWFHTDIRFVPKDLAMKFISYMHKFDLMFFGAKQTRDIIKEVYGAVFNNSEVIYNVIDKDLIEEKAHLFSIPNSEIPVFVSVARLQKRKGFDTLMKVHKRLINEGFNHKIMIIGDGDYRIELDKLFLELELDSRFEFLGTLKNPYPYVKGADFFILPSKTESYPLIIGEALCLGRPIISTDVGGIKEMIDNNIDGVLITSDEEAIYNAMKKFLTDKNFVENLAFNAKSSFKKFDKNIIYNQFLNNLRKLS